MMTNGPSARIGETLDIELERPRHRLQLADDPTYNHYRAEVLRFLHERHAHSRMSRSASPSPRLKKRWKRRRKNSPPG